MSEKNPRFVIEKAQMYSETIRKAAELAINPVFTEPAIRPRKSTVVCLIVQIAVGIAVGALIWFIAVGCAQADQHIQETTNHDVVDGVEVDLVGEQAFQLTPTGLRLVEDDTEEISDATTSPEGEHEVYNLDPFYSIEQKGGSLVEISEPEETSMPTVMPEECLQADSETWKQYVATVEEDPTTQGLLYFVEDDTEETSMTVVMPEEDPFFLEVTFNEKQIFVVDGIEWDADYVVLPIKHAHDVTVEMTTEDGGKWKAVWVYADAAINGEVTMTSERVIDRFSHSEHSFDFSEAAWVDTGIAGPGDDLVLPAEGMRTQSEASEDNLLHIVTDSSKEAGFELETRLEEDKKVVWEYDSNGYKLYPPDIYDNLNVETLAEAAFNIEDNSMLVSALSSYEWNLITFRNESGDIVARVDGDGCEIIINDPSQVGPHITAMLENYAGVCRELSEGYNAQEEEISITGGGVLVFDDGLDTELEIEEPDDYYEPNKIDQDLVFSEEVEEEPEESVQLDRFSNSSDGFEFSEVKYLVTWDVVEAFMAPCPQPEPFVDAYGVTHGSMTMTLQSCWDSTRSSKSKEFDTLEDAVAFIDAAPKDETFGWGSYCENFVTLEVLR